MEIIINRFHQEIKLYLKYENLEYLYSKEEIEDLIQYLSPLIEIKAKKFFDVHLKNGKPYFSEDNWSEKYMLDIFFKITEDVELRIDHLFDQKMRQAFFDSFLHENT